jgi:signal transduction histidine kinase/DNA-binding response OmpR family regulator
MQGSATPGGREERKGLSSHIRGILYSEAKGRRGAIVDVVVALFLTAVVAFIDYATGREIALSLFYLLPVGLASWRRGLYHGLAFAALCSVLWFLMERIGGNSYSHWLIAYWNAAVRGGIFTITAVMLSALRKTIRIAAEARDAALAASSAKSEFLSTMSHEIRTPLNAILAMADTLSETSLDRDQAEYVRIFKQEGRKLLSLINDLLDTAKVEANRLVAERISFALKDLLEEIASIAGAQARSKGLSFVLEQVPDLPPRIVGDPLLIRRVLLNLTGNAVKFTEAGGVSLKVGWDASSTDRRLLFSVSDTGVGIPPEALDRLFAPFSQADPSIGRRFGGTGLGLNLCKRFVELMGGSISVTSRLGEGSAFSFTIPLATPDAGESPQSEAVESSPVIILQRPLRILLVEDYEVNRAIVKTFLKGTPYRVDEAENGELGVEKRKSNSYDLILMDVQMPVMDGYAATRAIRAWEKENGLSPIPIVALTAHAYDDDFRNSRSAGCDAHLTKPYTKKRLLEAISSVVGGEEETCSAASAVAEERVALDPDIEALVPVFLADLVSLTREAREAMPKAEFDALKGIGHKIKGAGGSFGFERVSELGGTLEDAASERDRGKIEGVLAELEAFEERMGSFAKR